MNNNILEFFIKMRDLSGPAVVKTIENVRKIERTADMASRSIQGVTERTRSLGRTDPSSGPVSGLQRIRQEAEKTNATLEKTAGSGRSGGGGGLLGKLGRGFAISTALIGALSFGKSAVGSAMNYEATSKSYEVLTGSKAKGSGLASDLNRLQQNTILGPEVFKSGQTLLGFGVAADKVLPSIKMLGDVAMGDAERFNSLTLAFAQMTAAGRLQGQDLLQFVNAGFNPLLVISKQTGKSMMELRKQMEAGSISSQMVTKAFQDATGKGGQFNNMMEVMGETTGGKIAQLQGGIEALKISIGERMRPAVNTFVGGLTNIVSKVKSWFDIPIEKKLSDEIITIKTLAAQLSSANITHERQIELLNQLEQINPKILEGIDKQAVSYSKLRENVEKVTTALRDNIKLEVMKDKITPIIMKYEGAMKEREATIFDTMKGVTENFPSIANATNLNDEQKIATALVKARELEAAWYNANEDKRGRTRTPYTNLITMLNGQNSNINNLSNTISSLAPEYNKGMADIANQKQMVDKVLGIDSMVTAAGINGGGGKGDGKGTSKGEKSVAGGITSGGPRVINISGVNMKIADTVNVNAIDSKDFLDKMEPQAENMFLRILNSGASVQ